MSLRVSPRPHPSTISFDYSVSTLTRTFRIGKEKQNYFCALVDARTRVVRVVFEDRVPPRDELDEIERPTPPPSYPSQYALENYKFIKKQAYSLRSRDSFFLFFFLSFCSCVHERTYFMPRTRPSFVNDKDFSAERSLLPVLLVHLYENYRANDE